MSEFLGPIHYRMFEKACAVDAFARDLAAYSDAQGWTSGLEAATEAEVPRLDGRLEDHVDTAQIHASINALVARSENVLTFVCAHLEGHLPEVEAYALSCGCEAAREAQTGGSLQAVWDAIDRHWLDGMPCDGRLRFIDNDPDTVAWTVDLAPHEARGYAGIRDAWTRGFASEAGIALDAGEGSYRIRRAA